MIDLDFLQFQNLLRVKKEGDQRFIFDPIRKAWLVLQPEELVRQLVLQYLLKEKKYKKSHIKIERGLIVNEQMKRCDLIVYDLAVNPYLLIECKAPNIPISEDTIWQITNYNSQLNAPYLMLTNGRHTFCCKMDYKNLQHQFLDYIPTFVK